MADIVKILKRSVWTCVIILVLCSCKRGTPISCYDPVFKKGHQGICTADCLGVTGCDGKFYCNECEMHRAGVKKTK